MLIKGVIIRTKNQLERMRQNGVTINLVKLLENLTKTSKTVIPLVYQYCEKRNEELIIDSDNKIGETMNFRKDANGSILCDVEVYDILRLSIHFQNTIDNIYATLMSDNSLQLRAFIIYDRVFKDSVDRRNAELAKRVTLPKPGAIPVIGKDIDMSIVNEKLKEEFIKEMGVQLNGE